MRRRTPSGLLAVLIAAQVVVLIAGCGGGGPATVSIGEPAPSFELEALDGTTVASADFAGRPLLINFWATWCQPCLKEIPLLNEVAAERRVEVVAIALDEGGAATVAPFVARHGLRYPVLLGGQRVFERFGGFGIPYTLVLDAGHRVVAIHEGLTGREELERDLARALDGESPSTRSPG